MHRDATKLTSSEDLEKQTLQGCIICRIRNLISNCYSTTTQNTVNKTLLSYRALNPKQHSTCKKQPLHLQVKVNNPPETKLQENLGKWVSVKLVEERKNFMFHLKSGCFVWGWVGFFCLSVWLFFCCCFKKLQTTITSFCT